MMLLVSEWSLKSPLHNAIIKNVLYALTGSLFHKFGFFMDSLRIPIDIYGVERRNSYAFSSVNFDIVIKMSTC